MGFHELSIGQVWRFVSCMPCSREPFRRSTQVHIYQARWTDTHRLPNKIWGHQYEIQILVCCFLCLIVEVMVLSGFRCLKATGSRAGLKPSSSRERSWSRALFTISMHNDQASFFVVWNKKIYILTIKPTLSACKHRWRWHHKVWQGAQWHTIYITKSSKCYTLQWARDIYRWIRHNIIWLFFLLFIFDIMATSKI